MMDDRTAGAVYRYKGSYERFLEAKAARMVAEDAQAQADRNKLKKEAEWVGRQPQARQSKSKARIDAYQVGASTSSSMLSTLCSNSTRQKSRFQRGYLTASTIPTNVSKL